MIEHLLFIPSNPLFLALNAALALLAYQDTIEHRLKNRVTMPLSLFGMVYWLIWQQIDMCSYLTFSVCLPFMVCFVLYCIKACGAGDVKLLLGLLACTGIWFGGSAIIASLVLMSGYGCLRFLCTHKLPKRMPLAPFLLAGVVIVELITIA